MMKVLIRNQQRSAKPDQRKIISDSRKILRMLGLEKAELSILLVDDRKMKALNYEYLGKDKTTDVLSFPQVSSEFGVRSSEKKMFLTQNSKLKTPNFILGDVVINLQAVKRQAPEHGLAFNEELRWLLIHGILHLIGYDHEKSRYAERKLRAKERELLDYFGG